MEIDSSIQSVIVKEKLDIKEDEPLTKHQAKIILKELEEADVVITRKEYIFKEPSTRNLFT